jgi:hypothetical protein
MACTRDSNYQNARGTTPITNQSLFRRIQNSKYRQNKSINPSFAPTINNLSVYNNSPGAYSLVNINGGNFLPQCYGNTFVNFGPYKSLPITFYSSFNISFVVPENAPIGFYNVTVVNVYNSNFSPAINQTYPGTLTYSNSITYEIS